VFLCHIEELSANIEEKCQLANAAAIAVQII